jgi:hypothetical protein
LNHVSGGAINPQWLWRFRECSEFTSAFSDIADIAGLAAGSTQSQMTHNGPRSNDRANADRNQPIFMKQLWPMAFGPLEYLCRGS